MTPLTVPSKTFVEKWLVLLSAEPPSPSRTFHPAPPSKIPRVVSTRNAQLLTAENRAMMRAETPMLFSLYSRILASKLWSKYGCGYKRPGFLSLLSCIFPSG